MLPQARITKATTMTQKPWSVMTGIGMNAPMMAKAASTTEITKTMVVGGDRLVSSPPSC
jgi:hypothetical protein